MSLAGCCTVKLPCPPPAPDADTSHATDLLTRCQQTHEETEDLLPKSAYKFS